MIRKKVHNKSIISWMVEILYAFYALKTAWLAFFTMDYSPSLFYLGQILEILCIPFALLLFAENKVIRITSNPFQIMLPFISWSYIVFHHYEDIDVIRETFILLVILMFVFFTTEEKRRIFDYFYWIIIGTSFISICLYIIYVFGIDIGFKTEQYYASNWATYKRWLIFAIYQDGIQVRLCGIFNEPGGFGTVCALLFVARFQYSKTWEKIVLLLSVFFSFSMAGYLLVAVYFSIRLIRKSKKNILYILGIIFIVVTLLWIIPYIDFRNETLNMIASRFVIVNGRFAGDNRSNDIFNNAFAEFLDSNKAWFGYGSGYLLPGSPLGFKLYIVEYGVIGSFFWLFMWIIAGWKESKKDSDCIIFLLVYVLSLYQRPALIKSIYGYVLLFGGIQWISSAKKAEMYSKKSIEYSTSRGKKGEIIVHT